jgi:hypothetical protein
LIGRFSDWISALDGEWADRAVKRRVRLWVVVGLTVVVAVTVLWRPVSQRR